MGDLTKGQIMHKRYLGCFYTLQHYSVSASTMEAFGGRMWFMDTMAWADDLNLSFAHTLMVRSGIKNSNWNWDGLLCSQPKEHVNSDFTFEIFVRCAMVHFGAISDLLHQGGARIGTVVSPVTFVLCNNIPKLADIICVEYFQIIVVDKNAFSWQSCRDYSFKFANIVLTPRLGCFSAKNQAHLGLFHDSTSPFCP